MKTFKRKTFYTAMLAAIGSMGDTMYYGINRYMSRTGLMLSIAPEPGAQVAEVKTLIENQGKAWEEFKKTNDELIKAKADGKAVGDLEAKLAKIEKDFAGAEALNQRVTAAEVEAKAAKAEAAEAKAAGIDFETKFNRQGLSGKSSPKIDYNQWARAVVGAQTKGVLNLSADEQKALSAVEAEYKSMGISNDATGGYLAPSEFVNEIIKTVTLISPARQLARVRTTANKSVLLPKRTGQFSAQWTADQGTRSETTGLTYGMLEVFTHEMYALVDISNQNLEDSAFDLAAEVSMEATEQFAVAEGAAFVTGNAIGKPEGFLTNASVGTTNSGNATLVTADSLITLKHAIKSFYAKNANWVFNRTTMGAIRRLKDGEGNYLWIPGIANGVPNTIDGDPYVEVPDMPDQGAGAKSVAYGDFKRAYTLVDRIAMSMLRDPYTQATSGNIRFMFRRRIGGMVTQPEAIQILVCSA